MRKFVLVFAWFVLIVSVAELVNGILDWPGIWTYVNRGPVKIILSLFVITQFRKRPDRAELPTERKGD